MIRSLIGNIGTGVDAQKKAKVEMKRGTFVKANEKTGELELATALADVTGVVVRDTKVDVDIAMGLTPSEYSVSQDTVLVGEYCGHRAISKGERWATTQYVAGLSDTDAEAGKYLSVANGELVKSVEATTIVSLGWIIDGTNKLLGFKFI